MRLAYTVGEAAEKLGVSAKTIYLLCETSQLKHRRVNARSIKGLGKILIPHNSIINWLENN